MRRGKRRFECEPMRERYQNLSCCRMYRKHEGINGRLREHYQEVREKHSEDFCEIDWFEETIETESIELCTNPIDPDNKQPQVWNRMVTIIDGENYQIIEQSVGKRIFYGILRILIIPFRHLL